MERATSPMVYVSRADAASFLGAGKVQCVRVCLRKCSAAERAPRGVAPSEQPAAEQARQPAFANTGLVAGHLAQTTPRAASLGLGARKHLSGTDSNPAEHPAQAGWGAEASSSRHPKKKSVSEELRRP